MNMTTLRRGIRLVIGMLTLCLAGGLGAGKPGPGKSAAQLFASDCSGCKKSPQGLGTGGLAGLDSFLRGHYTARQQSTISSG